MLYLQVRAFVFIGSVPIPKTDVVFSFCYQNVKPYLIQNLSKQTNMQHRCAFKAHTCLPHHITHMETGRPTTTTTLHPNPLVPYNTIWGF